MPANNTVAYPELAARIEEKLRQNPDVPQGHGQMTWIQRELKRRYDLEVTRETVRTWIKGIREPRPAVRGHLAEILGVDVAWLMSGSSAPTVGTLNPAASEMIVALMLQAGGWKVRGSSDRNYDLEAQLGSRTYRIECKQARMNEDGTFRIKMPRNADAVDVIATFVDPSRGELALAHVSGEPGAEVTWTVSDKGLDATGGIAVKLTDLTQQLP